MLFSALRPADLGFDLLHECGRSAVEGFCQLEDGCEAGLLLAEFEDADVGASQVGLEPQLFLGKANLRAQQT